MLTACTCIPSTLYTWHNVGNHNFVLIGLAWQWSSLLNGDSPVLMTDTTQQCNTAQQIQCTNQEVMIVIIKLKHEVAEMANITNKWLSYAFEGLLHVKLQTPSWSTTSVRIVLFRVCCTHTHGKKTSDTRKTSLRKNCE